jgi:hypothetical protein
MDDKEVKADIIAKNNYIMEIYMVLAQRPMCYEIKEGYIPLFALAQLL